MILECVDQLPGTRRDILRLLKLRGPATTAEIARAFGLTHEGARKHVLDLIREGWLSSDRGTGDDDRSARGVGRPPVRYCLTTAGDHFFVKAYDNLLLSLLRIAADDREHALELLTRVTDERVERLRPRMAGKGLARRVQALQSIYLAGDAYTEVQRDGPDHLLIERNCPYLNAALAEPAICSTTVSTLRQVTGHEVVRERRFHDGDGRCVFRILGRRKASAARPRFELEPSPPQIPDSIVGMLR
ncbi:MAG TPA: helix-turn-helix domain-containing protein [Thermoanaerobaculia bacterium]|nr:helix-turn-helix domain-containing protein [Thermoanaerobaculia bacterium]